MFYGHVVYFMAIWHILWTIGTFYSHLVYIFPFWYVAPRQNLATLVAASNLVCNLDRSESNRFERIATFSAFADRSFEVFYKRNLPFLTKVQLPITPFSYN
jgi:hypothetical protein